MSWGEERNWGEGGMPRWKWKSKEVFLEICNTHTQMHTCTSSPWHVSGSHNWACKSALSLWPLSSNEERIGWLPHDIWCGFKKVRGEKKKEKKKHVCHFPAKMAPNYLLRSAGRLAFPPTIKSDSSTRSLWGPQSSSQSVITKMLRVLCSLDSLTSQGWPWAFAEDWTRASCVLGKHSASLVTSPHQYSSRCFRHR